MRPSPFLNKATVAATALCALNAAGCEPEYVPVRDPNAQITQLTRYCMDHTLPGYLSANFFNTHLRPWRQCAASQTPSTIITACNTTEIMQELLQALNRCLAQKAAEWDVNLYGVNCSAWPNLVVNELSPVISLQCEDAEGSELGQRNF